MKKLATFVFAMLLGASLSFAQATGGSTDTKIKTANSGKKVTKTKTYRKKVSKTGAANPASKVELNPQPLPPGGHDAGPKTTTPGANVTLNPQPLPPRPPRERRPAADFPANLFPWRRKGDT